MSITIPSKRFKMTTTEAGTTAFNVTWLRRSADYGGLPSYLSTDGLRVMWYQDSRWNMSNLDNLGISANAYYYYEGTYSWSLAYSLVAWQVGTPGTSPGPKACPGWETVTGSLGAAGLTITKAGTDFNQTYRSTPQTVNSHNLYLSEDGYYAVFYASSRWNLGLWDDTTPPFNAVNAYYYSDDVASPWLGTWSKGLGALPVPTVTEGVVSNNIKTVNGLANASIAAIGAQTKAYMKTWDGIS